MIKKHTCKHCGHYFGEISLKNSHERDCKANSSSVPSDNDCSDAYFDADLNRMPVQSRIYGNPVIPLEKRAPIWPDNE